MSYGDDVQFFDQSAGVVRKIKDRLSSFIVIVRSYLGSSNSCSTAKHSNRKCEKRSVSRQSVGGVVCAFKYRST